MLALVENETVKLLRRRRFLVVVLILAILIPIFTYAQYRAVQTAQEQMGTSDWRALLQQQIVDTQNRLASSRLPEEWREFLKIRVQQQQYYLDHDINPMAPGAPTFARGFMDQAVSLFLPMIIVVLAVDLVSAEYSEGTIKLLLTRPIRRWKVLTSKYITLLLFTSLTVLMTLLLAYLMSGVVFGYAGWDMPVLTGFEVEGGELNTAGVFMLPQWKYLLMQYGLGWFVSVVVGTITFMVSVLVRSAAAGMGIMMAALISGSILTQMASSWESSKYLFVVNLQLTDYLAGTLPPIKGMTLPFSLAVLSVWVIASLIVAYVWFIRRDVTS
ncbi:ABC transporter permease subunit [Brevibacillus composti]|uniref:ABC transporter permease subunit n=1 Tax=Brevibacillus composti TaxID=2796470 RepID=A0A7T5EPU0_9BACL|nr:ABC transporter permease [Brevibacillus composti]QQE76525.1 ABC transporter permease subunit [Brevibacillus composti]QUO43598.1 ABC transporter permease subunit [Brevibacillus composti]